jgi:MFS family permease
MIGSWLNRNVIGMGLTSLFADLCYETATAVLPALVKALGAPALALGLMEGTADAASSFVKMWSGHVSDRLPRRKPLAVAGYAVTALATAALALAVAWPVLGLLRVVAWVGKGLRGPPRNAMLAASVSSADRGKAFGVHRAGDTVGAILGPLVAAWLLGYAEEGGLDAVRSVLAWTLVPGLLSVLAMGLLVTEPARVALAPKRLTASLRALPAGYRRFLIGVGLFGLGDFSHSLLILAAVELLTPALGLTAAAQTAALLFAVRNVAAAVAAFPAGAVSDVVGRRGPLVAGYILSAAVTVGFAWCVAAGVASVWVLGALFAAAGVVNAVQEALEGAAAADLVPDEAVRGTAYGVLGAVNGVGDFVSSLFVGALWAISPVWGFAAAAALMAAGAAVLGASGGDAPPPVQEASTGVQTPR